MDLKAKLPRINIKSKFFRTMLGYKLDALYIYLIVFVIAEIMISGGLYEKGLIFGLVNAFLVLVLALAWQYRRRLGSLKDQIIRGVVMMVVYAVLDFLLVNLLLERFNNVIYSYWGTYAAYAIVLLVPILYLLAPRYIKRIKENKVSTKNLALDKP